MSRTTTAVRGTVAGVVAAVSRALPWTSDAQDAITLLETDHRRFERLLEEGEKTTPAADKKRRSLLDTLTADLNVHEWIEEKVLYPALKAHPEAADIVREGFEEHHVADLLVQELHELTTDNEQWAAKFKVLKESLEHHIQEEEGDMFRTARAVLTRDELLQMGERMAQMKVEANRTTPAS